MRNSNTPAPFNLRAAFALFLATGALAAPVSGAGADDAGLRPDDQRRMEALDATLGSALIAAVTAGAPADVTRLTTALHGPAVKTDPQALLGEWSCNTFKLGGDPGLVAYPPFKCRVSSAEGGAVLLEKLSGSQRVRGLIRQRSDSGLVLAGVAYIAGDAVPEYDALPETIDPTAIPQILPAPARVEVTADGRARVLFPQPMVESSFDILSLTR